jgi:hypothetical protein
MCRELVCCAREAAEDRRVRRRYLSTHVDYRAPLRADVHEQRLRVSAVGPASLLKRPPWSEGESRRTRSVGAASSECDADDSTVIATTRARSITASRTIAGLIGVH